MPREAFRDARERRWRDAERLLNDLPPRVGRQVTLVQYDLALRHGETGNLRDIFAGVESFPLLSVADWLLEDVGAPTGPDRGRVEGHLFRCALLMAAREEAADGISDPGGLRDGHDVALVSFLGDGAMAEIAQVVAPDSPFWRWRAQASAADAERFAEERDPFVARERADEPAATLAGARGRWAGTAETLAAAALSWAGREDAIDGAAGMLRELAAAYGVKEDLSSTLRDVERGRLTVPIVVTAARASIPLEPRLDAMQILGAMVVTGALEEILTAARSRLLAARQLAADLGLPTFVRFVDEALPNFQPPGGDGEGEAERGQGRRSGPLVALSEPTLRTAIDMARRFLLADQGFVAAWEVHREGMFGAPEVTSRFPAGFALELLCRHGWQDRAAASDFLTFTASNGFRYYDHPLCAADTDTIGLFMRLLPHADRHDGSTELEAVLGCLERAIRTSGQVPVWLPDCDDADPDRPPVLGLGEGCGTVSAHLLLGLLEVNDAAHRDMLETGTAGLLERLADVGLGANRCYPPPYALAAWFRLFAELRARDDRGAGANRLRAARGRLDADLDRLVASGPVGAQDAALLTTACLEAERAALVDPAWLTTILKRQRFDGGWETEPFAATPNRGSAMTWYSSGTLTTALCYDALTRATESGSVKWPAATAVASDATPARA